MERAATKSDDVRIALRDAAASVLVAAIGLAAVLFGAAEASGFARIALVVIGAFMAFTGMRAVAITVRRYRWKAARRSLP